MNRNCPECDGPHDCSGAWRDCLEYWKKRCLKAEAENARLSDLLRILKSTEHFPTSREVEMIDKALEGKP